MSVITDCAVMVNCRRSIDDGMFADNRVRVDYPSGSNHRPAPDVYGSGYNRPGMHRRNPPIGLYTKLLNDFLTQLIVSNAKNQSI